MKEDNPLAGLRVLLAEDEFMNKLLFEDMVAELDAEVVVSVSSADAVVPAAEAENPDVAILDINLKGRLVFDAALALRQRNIPFVIVSGYDAGTDAPEPLRNVPRLRKPFRLAQLDTALRQAVGAQARA